MVNQIEKEYIDNPTQVKDFKVVKKLVEKELKIPKTNLWNMFRPSFRIETYEEEEETIVIENYNVFDLECLILMTGFSNSMLSGSFTFDELIINC